MGTDPWGFDESRQAEARRARRRRRLLSFARSSVVAGFLAVLVFGGASFLRTAVLAWGLPTLIATSVFLVLVTVIGIALDLPFAYVTGVIWEREAGLSTQSTGSWVSDRAKGAVLTLVAVVVAGNTILWLLANEGSLWWIVAWVLGLAMTLVIGFVAPVLLAPLFFRFRPLGDPSLRARFEKLASAAGVPVIGVFVMGASAKTRRSNAAVVGFGRTRRIVITDTMLAGFSPEEIESVLAHELGHQRNRDPIEGFAVGAIVSFVMLAVSAWAYAATYSLAGLASPADMAGLPLLTALSGIISLILGPAELAWSRRREANADRLALELTRNPAAFASAMVKLHDQNLSVAHPTRWEELLTFSHPSGRERVETARAFAMRAA